MPIDSKNEDLILRDKLALSRTFLANQRTLLSFVRTGIYFVVTALGVAYLGDNGGRFGWLEWTLLGVGVIATVVGIINYFKVRKKIRSTY